MARYFDILPKIRKLDILRQKEINIQYFFLNHVVKYSCLKMYH